MCNIDIHFPISCGPVLLSNHMLLAHRVASATSLGIINTAPVSNRIGGTCHSAPVERSSENTAKKRTTANVYVSVRTGAVDVDRDHARASVKDLAVA